MARVSCKHIVAAVALTFVLAFFYHDNTWNRSPHLNASTHGELRSNHTLQTVTATHHHEDDDQAATEDDAKETSNFDSDSINNTLKHDVADDDTEDKQPAAKDSWESSLVSNNSSFVESSPSESPTEGTLAEVDDANKTSNLSFESINKTFEHDAAGNDPGPEDSSETSYSDLGSNVESPCPSESPTEESLTETTKTTKEAAPDKAVDHSENEPQRNDTSVNRTDTIAGLDGNLVLQNSTLIASNNSSDAKASTHTNSSADSREPPLSFVPPSATVLLEDNPSYDTVVVFEGNADVLKMNHWLTTGQFCHQVLGGAMLPDRPRTLINITFGCRDIFEHSGSGTGNFIAAFYGVRLIAHALGEIDVLVECSDASDTQTDLVLPWLTGFFPGLRHDVPLENRTRPTVEQACAHYGKISLGYKIPSMRYDLRRLARALVGAPYPNDDDNDDIDFLQHSPPDQAQMQLPVPDQPLVAGVDLDEAVVHFRCGDLIESNHPSFGFIKFQSFARHLDPTVQTIGIATQPFQDDDNHQQRPRERDQSKLDKCRRVVTAFVDYLQNKFPQATVTIRNSPDETIAVTFARFVFARQMVVAISTFSVVPALATYGHSYIREPDFKKAPNWFLMYPRVSTLVDNVELIQEPVLMAARLNRMWRESNGTAVLDWFETDVDSQEDSAHD